jgi:hypothetical protein
MWDVSVFLHQSPKNLILPPPKTPLFRLHLFTCLTGKAVIEDLSEADIVKLSKYVEEEVFSSHIPDVERRLFPVLLTQNMLEGIFNESRPTPDGLYVSTLIDVLAQIDSEKKPLLHGYKEHQILALIALNICAQSTLLYQKTLQEIHQKEPENLGPLISDEECYLELLKNSSCISVYEESITLAVEIVTYAKALHALELATSLNSDHAKKILSKHAKLAIGKRHTRSKNLQKKFIAYYEANKNNGTFKTIEQAANLFYDALADNMKIYKETNATRTLVDALRQHRKTAKEPRTST